MLNNYERQTLGEVERQMTAADPEFATALRDGQQRLPGAATRPRYAGTVTMLVLLTVALLVLGLPASALAVAALAAGLWWLREHHIIHQETR